MPLERILAGTQGPRPRRVCAWTPEIGKPHPWLTRRSEQSRPAGAPWERDPQPGPCAELSVWEISGLSSEGVGSLTILLRLPPRAGRQAPGRLLQAARRKQKNSLNCKFCITVFLLKKENMITKKNMSKWKSFPLGYTKLILVKSLLFFQVTFSTCTHSLWLMLSIHPHPNRCTEWSLGPAKTPSPALSQAAAQSGGLHVASRKMPRVELPLTYASSSFLLSVLTPGRCGAQTNRRQSETDGRPLPSPAPASPQFHEASFHTAQCLWKSLDSNGQVCVRGRALKLAIVKKQEMLSSARPQNTRWERGGYALRRMTLVFNVLFVLFCF